MKYNIENNIDFYKELYESLNKNEEVNLDTNDLKELCLITNLPLTDKFVELKCGHKFNYEPLYKDVLNHKKKFNNMEQIKTRLKFNQLRCPYCRNIQDELLPYYHNLSYPKEHGVNFYDISKANLYYNHNINNHCQYETHSVDGSGNNVVHMCNHYGYVHSLLQTKYNNNNKYCYTHKMILIKEIKESIKQKLLKEKQEMKLKLLEEKKKIKEEQKQKKLLEKLMKKKKQPNLMLENNENDENVNLENIILVENVDISNELSCYKI